MSSPPRRDIAVGVAVDRTGTSAPAIVESVGAELLPGDPEAWRPTSFSEWEARERTRTFLGVWSAQVVDERDLRRTWATWIFVLIVCQVLGAFGLLVLQGRGVLILDVSLLKVIVPTVFSEVFGLGFVVAKYLFSQAVRHSLDSLALGATQAHVGETATSPLQRTPLG